MPELGYFLNAPACATTGSAHAACSSAPASSRLAARRSSGSVPLVKVEATAERIVGARLEILPGIGHDPMEELPGFADRFVRWIVELDRT
jgi:pimeloyl-ACP methyl ester carboxylesterase